MALDKKRASLLTRIGIGIIAVMLVLAFIPWDSIGLSGGSGTSGSSDENGQVDAIAAQYSTTASSFRDALASDPTSYTVLVNLGNTYFDWALAVQQVSQTGAQLPIWDSATIYYGRALEVQPGEPSVTTDYAIALYYSGDTDGAIDAAVTVMTDSPDFAPAFFNAAIFFNAAGRSPEAVAAATRYLELDPQGQYGDPALAQQIIDGTFGQ